MESELLQSDEIIPLGAAMMTDLELKERKVYEGWRFSLGWWPDGHVGIDVGEASVGPERKREQTQGLSKPESAPPRSYWL